MWIAVLLSASPVGELTPEFIYLTAADLRSPAMLVLAVLALEAVELFYPILHTIGLPAQTTAVHVALNVVQAALLLFAAVQALLVLLRYTHRGLERRIRDTIDTLAFLQGQRRRRRRT